jgi:uncharacterized protein DUF4396
MEHTHHHHEADAGWRTAVSATLHCLTGCAIGEILGMVIATAFGLNNAASIVLAIVLAFFFGYALTIVSLIRVVNLARASRLAFASDTASIATMEVVDNLFIVAVPGALAAELTEAEPIPPWEVRAVKAHWRPADEFSSGWVTGRTHPG